MAPTTEAGLVQAIAKAIHTAYPDSWAFKVVGSPYQVAGIPDCLFCIRGLLIGLEVKHRKPGESREHALARATPQQLVQIMRINRAGGVAGVVLSVHEALELIGSGLTEREERQRHGT